MTYQGEEMALENVEISYEDTVDPSGMGVTKLKFFNCSQKGATF